MPLSRPIRKPAAMGRRLVQLALDFFSPAAVVEAASVVKAFDSQPKEPFSLTDKAPKAIKNIAPPPVHCLESFVHPRASRQVLLDGRLVAYEVKRGTRRTIGFCVGSDGLAVSVPKWLRLDEIDNAVHAKSSWILKKLTDTRQRQQHIESARIEWKEGASFPFLGKPVQVVLELSPGKAQAVLDAHLECATAVRLLRIKLPSDASPDAIQQVVRLWLMQQARQIFTARLDFFAPQLGVQWRKLGLSNAMTRWGSASSSGAIRLNWRLMHFTQELVDYVVVHELSHLRVMDHSPRFWAIVESVLPDHAALRRQLKKESILREPLSEK